jgi:hypothetical protein
MVVHYFSSVSAVTQVENPIIHIQLLYLSNKYDGLSLLTQAK